jgi:hypothetical protein
MNISWSGIAAVNKYPQNLFEPIALYCTDFPKIAMKK